MKHRWHSKDTKILKLRNESLDKQKGIKESSLLPTIHGGGGKSVHLLLAHEEANPKPGSQKEAPS